MRSSVELKPLQQSRPLDSQGASAFTLIPRMEWWSRQLALLDYSNFRAYNRADLRSWTSAILTALWISPSLRPSTKYFKEITSRTVRESQVGDFFYFRDMRLQPFSGFLESCFHLQSCVVLGLFLAESKIQSIIQGVQIQSLFVETSTASPLRNAAS
ncbi:hypothetical protein TNCV_1501991 [Trichonephila clavipes]|uniref:Uncharacterized protein n=1 Tax=Trichonephila clavipes TaxID=2585209 RepID=A0A8X6RN95_TRICX|nr:hypothetical protein TNCV_1501991 [Trichonephila clavipes]